MIETAAIFCQNQVQQVIFVTSRQFLPTQPAFGAAGWRNPQFEFREDAWNQKSRIPRLWSGIVSVIRLAALAENFDGLPDLAR